jgi:hypothetical protein
VENVPAVHKYPNLHYKFEPHDYGPFNENIHRDLDALAADGAIFMESVPMRRWPVYAITPEGEHRAEQGRRRSPRNWSTTPSALSIG